MKTPYDKLFLDQAILGKSVFDDTKKLSILKRRRDLLNNEFKYTPEVAKKVMNLQDIFTQKMKTCLEFTQSIETQIKQKIKESPVDIDYDFVEYEVSLWSSKKYAHVKELEGLPFYSYNIMYTINIDFLLDFKLPPGFTALTHNHPIQGIHHNMLLHDLFDHHPILSFTDILEVEEIFIEPTIRLQNNFKL